MPLLKLSKQVAHLRARWGMHGGTLQSVIRLSPNEAQRASEGWGRASINQFLNVVGSAGCRSVGSAPRVDR